MGTLFSTLDIARSGLSASQTQVDVAAHNIANVNTEGYSRQRAELSARSPVTYPFGQLGRGVEVTGVQRLRDTFLDNVYRQQVPNLAEAAVTVEYYARIEDLFSEPSDSGFSSNLSSFFDSLSDFANSPESMSARESVVAQAQSISSSLQQLASRLDDLRSHANEQIRELVPTVNDISDRIAALNDSIRLAEAGGTAANDLRDERDALLDELSQYMDITTQEHTDGQVDVIVGGDLLVSGVSANHIEAVRTPSLDEERDDLVTVQFEGSGRPLRVEAGQLHGLFEIRDTIIPEMDAEMDTIASSIIEQINSIHSQGNGLVNLSGTVTSSNAVTDSSAALDSAGLPFTVSPGTFDLVVYDASGTATTSTITVTTGESLDDLAASLSGVTNMSASVNADGTLSITADSGYSFSFANDSTNALVALGVNGLFTGTDARSIGVSQAVVDDPSILTSSYSLDPLETGDNKAALAMSSVCNLRVLDGASATINDFYEASVARLGVESASATSTRDMEESFVQDFDQRRTEVSGVSIDEEVTTMIQFQRAFQASSRVIGIVDSMLETLINAF